ncbi:ABC-F family ATP-binding cassette domain-containing protein [Gehongia tenuis]|uniref:ABC-F family ATP-binding cassette domain-containing protein n=1 Tax=Gehongia tenuis TaxID=2763655 RepID=A0A926D500_9FIRM|nr:ABC-F family ATP-binding cassette domain-containing protein [Gehongia tenuis]MBC8531562.1 ABC-F family ATP-binding cassette domain-containing protein [Gehongia tenuis]
MIIQLSGIEKYFGVQPVLQGADLMIQEKQRLGIVGANGAGKTTLMRIMLGLEGVDKGTIHQQKGLRVGYLPQHSDMESTSTVYEEMLSVYEPVFEMERRLAQMEAEMGQLHDSDPKAYAQLTDAYDRMRKRFEDMDGYGYNSSIQGVLAGLGFQKSQYDQPAHTLSGGQKARLSLAKLLVGKPDVLMMDEPTNHLDIRTTRWLETYLQRFEGALVIISHDRYFLDTLCDSIADVHFGRIHTYQGNYSQFRVKKQAQLEQQQKEYELYCREVERQKEIIETYRSFNREKSIKAAESREKALARMTVVERPPQDFKIAFEFPPCPPSGQDVLTAQDLAMAFDGKTVFEGLGFRIQAGDRIGVIGPNGSGKSTLIKILAKKLRPTQGELFWGAGVKPAYYDQQLALLDENKTLMDQIWDAHPALTQTRIRSALAAFGFVKDEVFKTISMLSGGEQSRVALVELLLKPANLLLLDEPTNHLDMDACQALENALIGYEGTLITISHDRYFINRIANRIFEIKDGQLLEVLGNYDDYAAYQQRLQEEEASESVGPTKTARVKAQKALRVEREQLRQQKKALEQVENDIAVLEKDMEGLAGTLSSGALSAQESLAAAQRYAAMEESLNELMERWEAMQSE